MQTNEAGIALAHVDNGGIWGRYGDFEAKLRVEAQSPEPRLRIDTDKPIYQPGQTVHIRSITIGEDGKAAANAEQSFEIDDSESNTAHKEDVTTSRFGIAATDWKIPENAAPGSYTVKLEDAGGNGTESRFEVRRYTLPSFRVRAQPAKPYFKPDEPVKVEIDADYLFGKPVPHGRARIQVKDEDEPLWSGELDAQGKVTAALPAYKTEGTGLFTDHEYTAYATDTSTNVTEQSNFVIRESPTDRHLYVKRIEPAERSMKVFVSLYTAGGDPAPNGRITAQNGGACVTNRFGVCRLETQAGKTTLSAPGSNQATAESPGHHDVSIRTDRTLYRLGDPIICWISAPRVAADLVLRVSDLDGNTISVYPVSPRDGQAEMRLHPQKSWGNDFVVSVLDETGDHASQEILIPGAATFHVSVATDKQVYSPNGRALLRVKTSEPTGVGISIVDESVLQRAEVAEEQYGPEAIGGVTKKMLLDMSPSKIDADYDLVAFMLVRNDAFGVASNDRNNEVERAFRNDLARETATLQNALNTEYMQELNYPTNENSYREFTAYAGDPRDPWGQPFFPVFSTEGERDELCITSAGPDKKPNTPDDICARQISRPWFGAEKSIIRRALQNLQDYPRRWKASFLCCDREASTSPT